MNKPVTSTSRISIRFTTAPADMGYGGTKTAWRTGPADRVTSPRLALDYIADLKRTQGGAEFALDLRCGGVEVSRDDLLAAVIAAEGRRAR